MTPNSIEMSTENYEIQPSLTYKLDLENKKIMGMVNNEDSVFQAITKMLSTDKYAHEIYDWNYGQELLKLVGKEYSYIKARLPKLVEETLYQDDRIKDITDFKMNQIDIDSISISFKVITIFSSINYTMEVKIL